jgi:hypothetical protein
MRARRRQRGRRRPTLSAPPPLPTPKKHQQLSKFQEEPQLLDGHLESLVSPLARLLRRRATLAAERQPAPPPGAGTPLPPLCPQDAAAALDVGHLLGAIVSVRGAKAVARFLTHEAADLEVALGLLLRLEAAEKAAAEAARDDANPAAPTTTTATTWSPAEGAAARSWPWQEAQAVVLLWLSLLALAPFDLAVLDSSLDAAAPKNAGPPQPPPLARRLASACAARLHETGAAREMAALVLARLLTRPDMGALLAEFFEWQRLALGSAAAAVVAGATGAVEAAAATGAAKGTPTSSSTPSPSTFLLAWPPFPTEVVPAAQAAARATFFAPGALRALGLVFKLGPRSVCAPLAACAWEQLEVLLDQEQGGGGQGEEGGGRSARRLLSASPLARRLVAKVAQRVALALLAPPPNPPSDEQQGTSPPPPQPLELHEAVEGALGWLLDGALSDRDTVVRWSGAKGVARVAASLPCAELADEVVSSVLGSLFVEGGSDAAWHGGCLALAELARRGCLRAERHLGKAAPLLARALAFDAPARGGCAAHSVGAHVRDAAAYACWALARAFGSGGGGGGGGASSSSAATVERAFLDSLAPALLAAACYDREVNCRRAAAAAFQEAVGRLGGNCLAHGLEALHAAQYSSVGQAAAAALRAAPQIAALGEKGGYRPALVEALVERQLRHWDGKGTRALAAKALAALVPALVVGGGGEGDNDNANNNGGIALLTGEGGAIARLLARVGPESTLEERTGALMALGEVLPALATAHNAPARSGCSPRDPLRLRPSDAVAAAALLPRLASCGLYRGRGGEATREAAARLLEGVSRAQEQGARQRRQQGQRRQEQQQQRWSLPLDASHHAAARLLLDDCARHPSERVRRAGEGALRAYAASLVGAAARTRKRRTTVGAGEDQDDATADSAADAAAESALPPLEELVDRTWPERLLTDALPIHRRGAAGALGALPARFLLVGGGEGQQQQREDEGDGDDHLAERRRARPEALLRALAAAALEGAEPDRLELPLTAARPAAAAAAAASASRLAAECRDAVARAEAAAALGRVCGELWGGGGGVDDDSPQRARSLEGDVDAGDEGERAEDSAGEDDGTPPPPPPPNRALLPQIVLPALLSACRDCTTDSRGDAGAWVREAAVGALGRALPPALALAAAVDADAATAAAAAGDLCRDAVGAFLQQALGRIARLRHAALRELRALLPPVVSPAEETEAAAAAAAAYRVLPGAAAVSRAVHAERDLDEAGVASLRAFGAVAELLLAEREEEEEAGTATAAASSTSTSSAACYRYPWLVEGVVAAAGGIDVSLARAAGRVLARTVSTRGRTSAAAEVAGALVRLWARVQRQRQRGGTSTGGDDDDAAGSGAAAHARLATPLVRAALLVLRKGKGAAWLPVEGGGGGCADNDDAAKTTTTVPFAAAVVDLLRAEVRGCTDIPRLVEAAALAAELTDQASRRVVVAGAAVVAANAAPPPPLDRLLALRADAARLLLVLLGNRYPRVRRGAAEAAYVAVLGMRADVVAADGAAAQAPLPAPAALDDAAALLLEGQAWDGADLGEARAARDALAALLGVEAPKAVVTVVAEASAAATAPPDAAPSAAAAAAAALLLRSATATTATKAAGCRFDENASYQSLLDDAARGGGY